ncbi:MAG: endo-1,4-beta-xylanase Z [Muribaculaceae bacterium]|nr:endo-1,4-beta-xylanase Z [Muribaculaceae bacterium]
MGKILERRKAISHFAPGVGSGTVEHCSMSSDVLGTNKDFSVYLPAGYGNDSDRRYPVMYLFHPAGGTHEMWISKGDLPSIADDTIRSGMAVPMIVVIPDASGEDADHAGRHMGFFSVEGWDYETYFHKELIPLIDTTYHTIADKAHRAIVGASMGGEAAIAYAQKYHDFYGCACALCGILGHPEQSVMAQSDKNYADSLIKNNPTAFVENATPDTIEALKTIRWYADCGDNDYFCEGNIAFFIAMKKKGIQMDYRMRSGVHGWYYWITGLAPIMQFISIGMMKSEQ